MAASNPPDATSAATLALLHRLRDTLALQSPFSPLASAPISELLLPDVPASTRPELLGQTRLRSFHFAASGHGTKVAAHSTIEEVQIVLRHFVNNAAATGDMDITAHKDNSLQATSPMQSLPPAVCVFAALHEFAHCLAPVVLVRAKSRAAARAVDADSRLSRRYVHDDHNAAFYAVFANLLRAAADLGFLAFAKQPGLFSPRHLRRLDKLDVDDLAAAARLGEAALAFLAAALSDHDESGDELEAAPAPAPPILHQIPRLLAVSHPQFGSRTITLPPRLCTLSTTEDCELLRMYLSAQLHAKFRLAGRNARRLGSRSSPDRDLLAAFTFDPPLPDRESLQIDI